MSNLAIWDRVCQTDPDMTERVNFGAFKFTTIDAMYQVRQATLVFGPCGTGWGIRNQKFEMLTIDPTDAHYNLLMYTAELWYKHDGQESVYEIAADIELFEKAKGEWRRVSDPMKKVRTDALTKGLSWLGFSADVFMGRFDDARYVQGLHQNKRQEQSKKQGPELAGQEQLEQIQKLAYDAGLVGADFAQWLRDSYNTSWSRITSQAADSIISGLNQLLEKSDDKQSAPVMPDIVPVEPVTQGDREKQAAELRIIKAQILDQAKAINLIGDDLKLWLYDTHGVDWKGITTGKAPAILADLVAIA